MAAATLATPLFDIELSMSLLMEQLGLEDIGAIHRLAAGASTVADDLFATEEYALRIQAEYLGNILQIVEDHRLALALDEGLEANYPAFRDFDTGTNPPAPDNQRVDIIPVPPENDIVDEPDVGHYPGNDLPNSTLLYVSTRFHYTLAEIKLSGLLQHFLHPDWKIRMGTIYQIYMSHAKSRMFHLLLPKTPFDKLWQCLSS